MSNALVAAQCIFSIDVSCPGAAAAMADVCRQFAAAEVPVTWSVSEAPGNELRQAIEQHSGCEVAVLADPVWAAEGSSRSLFCDGLAQRLTALRSVGLVPTTLSLSTGRLAAHDDVLVRHGFNVVRVATGRQQEPGTQRWWRRTESEKPVRPLRWGLWEIAVNVDLGITGIAGAGRTIDRITRRGGGAVIAADATTLEREVKRLPRLLDHLKRRRDEKRLAIETAAASVARQQAPRQTPARSILRPAA